MPETQGTKRMLTVRLTDRQHAYLRKQAQRLEISIADVLRRMIDAVADADQNPEEPK